MPFIEHNDVQVSDPWDARVFIRELNTRFMDLVSVVNLNRQDSGHNNVPYVTAADETVSLWMATANYEIIAMSASMSAGTGSVSPLIGGVAVGGAPFTATTTATKFDVTAPYTVAALDVVGLTTAALGGNTLVMSLELRRIS
jgi:hypothetical protein